LLALLSVIALNFYVSWGSHPAENVSSWLVSLSIETQFIFNTRAGNHSAVENNWCQFLYAENMYVYALE